MKTVKTVKAFGFGQTIHDKPLTQKGRDTYDNMDWNDHPKDKRKPNKER